MVRERSNIPEGDFKGRHHQLHVCLPVLALLYMTFFKCCIMYNAKY